MSQNIRLEGLEFSIRQRQLELAIWLHTDGILSYCSLLSFSGGYPGGSGIAPALLPNQLKPLKIVGAQAFKTTLIP